MLKKIETIAIVFALFVCLAVAVRGAYLIHFGLGQMVSAALVAGVLLLRLERMR